MRISTDKIISLLFFILSVFYLYQTYQIQVFSFDEHASFNAKTLPTFLAYLGMFLSVLYVILPEKNPSEAWAKLSEIDRSESLLSREINVIDLRKNGYLIIKPSENYIAERST